ncbi:hypothetical protein ABS767_09440 [Sphingomonas sp. ST-64]|uniref:Uncharacterized protein n=1 Tax=Sphingomonas plantiphila TaxID=3163295 RepID=A0ABW8YLM8_9SPHN
MRLAKLMMTVAAASLATAPALASSSASKLSLSSASQTRAATATGKSNKQLGGFLIPAIIVVALGVGIYFAVEDNDDEPTSP